MYYYVTDLLLLVRTILPDGLGEDGCGLGSAVVAVEDRFRNAVDGPTASGKVQKVTGVGRGLHHKKEWVPGV